MDAQDYLFISSLQFEQNIQVRQFVKHGEYKKSYGTSLEAIGIFVLAVLDETLHKDVLFKLQAGNKVVILTVHFICFFRPRCEEKNK